MRAPLAHSPGFPAPRPTDALENALGQQPTRLSRHEIASLFHIAGIAGSTTDSLAAATEILDVFSSIIPFAAGGFSIWNPLTDRHETLVNLGYPDFVMDHLNQGFVWDDHAYHIMRYVDPRPLRWQDVPFNYRESYSALEIFNPAGYDNGVTTCLYTPSGRYTGGFHVSCDTAKYPTDTSMEGLFIIQRLVAGLVDVLRTPGWIAASIDPLANAALIGDDGFVAPLPGRATGPHLAQDGGLSALISQRRRLGQLPGRFLWRAPDDGWHRVRTQMLDTGVVGVQWPCPALPCDLTPRELDVLTLVADGRSNAQIGLTLAISIKTVGKHVEHIMDKLGASSRMAAATVALDEGYVTVAIGNAPA